MNGQQRAQFYAKKVRDWLATSPKLPLRVNGNVNQSELSRVLGIPRDSLYKNPTVVKLLAEFIEQLEESRNQPLLKPCLNEGGASAFPTPKIQPVAPVDGPAIQPDQSTLRISKLLRKKEVELQKLKERNSLLAIESQAKSETILRLRRQLFREQETFATGRLWRDL